MRECDGQMWPKGNLDFSLNHLLFLSLCHEISTKTDHIIAHRYSQESSIGNILRAETRAAAQQTT